MELELSIFILNHSHNFITLFLYGIGAITCLMKWLHCNQLHYSYMELEPTTNAYPSSPSLITLFLYGIGAWNSITGCSPSFHYIIPIWNWSSFFLLHFSSPRYHYIIPIWNWSKYLIISFSPFANYYIIPIWNWSSWFGSISSSTVWLHYSYMELELFLHPLWILPL